MFYPKEHFLLLKKLDHKYIQGSDCKINFLQDLYNNELWVLKQVINPDPEEQILLLFDYIGALIANKCNIPVPQKTYLIPIDWYNEYKEYPSKIAILQSLAPGEQCYNLLSHQNINVQQTYGLNIEIFKPISQHEDLIKIIAFDTFINN